MLKSQNMMSQLRLSSEALSAAGVSTRSNDRSNPDRRRSRTSSSASSSESSTIRAGSFFFRLSSVLGGRLVQNEPVHLELLHGLGKLDEVHRLPDIAFGAELVPFEPVLFLL